MTDYVLERDGDVPLRFTGEFITRASSRVSDSQKRWQELELYRTAGGTYVFRRVGYSDVPGEVDYHFATSSKEPREIVKSMYHTDENGVRFLTHIAREFLDDIARDLSEFREFVVEEIA